MPMTESAFGLKIDTYVDFLHIGDAVKMLLTSMWGRPTEFPNLFHSETQRDEQTINSNIWVLETNVNRERLFFRNNFEFCIITYDTRASVNSRSSDRIYKYIAFGQSMSAEKIIVVIAKDQSTPESAYQTIKQLCQDQGVYCMPVDITHEGLTKARNLIHNLSSTIYDKRVAELSSKLDALSTDAEKKG